MNLFELVAKVGLDRTDYDKGVRGVQSSGKALASDLGGAMTNVAKTVGKAAVAAVSAGATAITGLGVIGLKYNAEMESYVTNFKVMLGSTEAAVTKVESLKKMAAETPFEMTDLASATQTLLAFSVPAEKTNGILQKLGDISLGNAQKMQSLARAYGKMNAAQKVTLEDINIMIDAGFNPLLGIAEETGEEMSDLYKRLSKGGVGFEELQAAITKATAKGGQFFNGMKEASKTTTGLLSTLKDNATALIANVFKPISNELTTRLLPDAIKTIEELTKAFDEKGVSGLIETVGRMVSGAIDTLIEKTPAFIKQAIDMLGAFIGSLNTESALYKITQGAIGIVNSLSQGIADNAGIITEKGLDMLIGFIKGITDNLDIPAMKDASLRTIKSIAEKFKEAFPEIMSAGTELISSLISGAEKAATDPETYKKIFAICKDIVKGFADGLLSAVTTFVDDVLSGKHPIASKLMQFGQFYTGLFNIPAGGGGTTATPQGGSSGSGSFGGTPAPAPAPSRPKPNFNNLGSQSASGTNKVSFGGMSSADYWREQAKKKKARGHASGIGYVPFDNYPALLHEGEMVLTRQQSAQFNSASFGDIIVNVQGAQYDDERSLAAAIAEEIQSQIDRKRAVYA